MSEASETARVGLCLRCRHVRRLESAKSSVFYKCARAANDESLRDYPPLPVQSCHGFESGPTPQGTKPTSQG